MEIILAPATPMGESATGVLRLSGSGVIELVSQVFRSGRPLSDVPGRFLLYGRLFRPEGGAVIDDCVASVYRAPASYTGEDVVELSCHGNPLILKDAIDLLLSRGARMARPGEFTERAFLNGKMDLSEAEAVNDLIRAHTRHALASARSQAEGSLSREAEAIRSGILDILALVEAAIDHGDLDERFYEPADLLAKIDALCGRMEKLLGSSDSGRIVSSGMRVAICGAPNAGKSSLLNMLLREERAIVSPIPGTTRDVVSDELSVRGIPVRVSDTAGIHAADDPVEREGIERAKRAAVEADFILAVIDRSKPLSSDDLAALTLISGRPGAALLNKCDLPAAFDETALSTHTGLPVLRVSAAAGEGLAGIEDAIEARFFSLGYRPGVDALLTNARQEDRVRRSLQALRQAANAIAADESDDLCAVPLRRAKIEIEELTGRSSDDALLDRIFSRFCIGK